MDILLIEDDSFKCDSIVQYISTVFGKAQIEICNNLSEGIISVNNKAFDFILVDMAIPSHPIEPGGGSPLSLLTGGLDIILEVKYLERNDPCIIITQYPDLELCGQLFSLDQAVNEIYERFDCKIRACIEYKEGSDEWQQELHKALINK
jgi:DNA-binding NarL/FixJ family response regulator